MDLYWVYTEYFLYWSHIYVNASFTSLEFLQFGNSRRFFFSFSLFSKWHFLLTSTARVLGSMYRMVFISQMHLFLLLPRLYFGLLRFSFCENLEEGKWNFKSGMKKTFIVSLRIVAIFWVHWFVFRLPWLKKSLMHFYWNRI